MVMMLVRGLVLVLVLMLMRRLVDRRMRVVGLLWTGLMDGQRRGMAGMRGSMVAPRGVVALR